MSAEVTVTLKDGATRAFSAGISAGEIAAAIAPSLAKRAVAVRINGELADLSAAVSQDCAADFVLRSDDDALPLIRHDCAHLLAQAVAQLFPEAKPTIGPAVENGFYYDFQRDTPFTESDLADIEKRMRELAGQAIPILREEWTRQDAREHYAKRDEPLKIELLDAIPEGETVSFYRQGDFADLCRGPHMRTTADAGAGFKLMKVAGSYWRGDARRERLQRIYGTAWRDEKELRAYLKALEEAEARDHRKLGPMMRLFHFQARPRGFRFGTTPGGRSTASWKTTSGGGSGRRTIRKCARRSWPTASCGRPPGIGRSSARTCIWRRPARRWRSIRRTRRRRGFLR